MMRNMSDFLILGGGILGCATAYYLSLTGASVTVLERGDTASGTVGASGGLVNWITCGPTQMALFLKSQEMLETLEEELGANFELNYNSYNLQIITNETEWEASAQLVKEFKMPGFEAKLIDQKESLSLEPGVTDDMLGSIYVPRVHYLNPIKQALAYRAAAAGKGVKFFNGADATGLHVEGGRVTGVKSRRGDFYAPTTVNCCGVWGEQVSRLAGVHAPVHPIRGEFVVSEPTRRFCNTTISSAQYQVVVQHPELFGDPRILRYNLGFSLEQTSTGACIIHGTREMDSGLDNRVIPEVMELLVQTACRYVPRLRKLRMIRAYAGVRPGTPDGDPYMGFAGDAPGFCLNYGHGGEGIALAPGAAKAVAELLTGGAAKIADLSGFDPGRPLPGDANNIRRH